MNQAFKKPWRSASSIILLSKKTNRILMMKRGSTAKFMPNALVFPGGVVDKSDQLSGTPERTCALRELFEETGILFKASGKFESAEKNEELSNLQDKTCSAPHFFEKAGANGQEDMIHWNTWLTPTHHSQRFLTSFFLALVDDEPKVRMCTAEMSEYRWVAPEEPLRLAASSKISLPPPQVYELTRIAQDIKWKGEEKISNVLPGDHLYIEEDCYHQASRTLEPQELQVQAEKSTHRIEFKTKPLWSDCKVYQHKLPTKYDFHSFDSHSSQKV
ncbi:unnamed protein product [Caenorhabditis auriculariae]|uniref:Nudix hydrolase domain-containing protein n=1 Tax=Caenorhabditis auriculariae TaxID=2777116 RepID=A0A8S1GLW9_9PELO|nr:unnamed protein product [Caenorhabditis auriculariae]